jgi:hypothetical protein
MYLTPVRSPCARVRTTTWCQANEVSNNSGNNSVTHTRDSQEALDLPACFADTRVQKAQQHTPCGRVRAAPVQGGRCGPPHPRCWGRRSHTPSGRRDASCHRAALCLAQPRTRGLGFSDGPSCFTHKADARPAGGRDYLGSIAHTCRRAVWFRPVVQATGMRDGGGMA